MEAALVGAVRGLPAVHAPDGALAVLVVGAAEGVGGELIFPQGDAAGGLHPVGCGVHRLLHLHAGLVRLHIDFVVIRNALQSVVELDRVGMLGHKFLGVVVIGVVAGVQRGAHRVRRGAGGGAHRVAHRHRSLPGSRAGGKKQGGTEGGDKNRKVFHDESLLSVRRLCPKRIARLRLHRHGSDCQSQQFRQEKEKSGRCLRSPV